MKALNIIAWISAATGVLIVLCAAIAILFQISLFGFVHAVNYFTAASTFFLFTIALFIYAHKCNTKE